MLVNPRGWVLGTETCGSFVTLKRMTRVLLPAFVGDYTGSLKLESAHYPVFTIVRA